MFLYDEFYKSKKSSSSFKYIYVNVRFESSMYCNYVIISSKY